MLNEVLKVVELLLADFQDALGALDPEVFVSARGLEGDSVVTRL